MSDRQSTTDEVVHLGLDGAGLRRRRRLTYAVSSAALVAVVAAGVLNLPGVRSSTVRAAAGGYTLEVTHPTVTRGGLASPFEIRVTRGGGFDGPVTIALTADYLGLFDENGLDPQPSSEQSQGDLLIWEFEAPEGDELRVSYDARIEPAVQSGDGGQVSVRSADGDRIVSVDFHTTVLP